MTDAERTKDGAFALDHGTVGTATNVAGDGAPAAGEITVTLKLYASLGVYLPTHAARNQADVTAARGITARALLDSYSVPPEACHLVLVNGVYQPPSERTRKPLADGDALAVWPPVAGG